MQWLGGVADEETKAAAQARLLKYRADHGHTFWVMERKEDGAILPGGGFAKTHGVRATPRKPPSRR